MFKFKIFIKLIILTITYFTASGFVQEDGLASFYADSYHGRPTASGELYDKDKMTAAHMTLPFNTRLRVINKNNDKEVVVKVNDRGNFKPGRVIDLSKAAAEALDMIDEGLVPVSLEIIEK